MPQLIEHRIYGKGEVIESRYKGFELHVKFADGLLRWIRRDEVRFLTETPVLSKLEVPEPIMPKEEFKARQMIEAFRLGIVPHEHIEEFTFGRDEEIERIKNWLNRQNEGSQMVIGEYGTGKTHLLEYIYLIALKNNWAVSLVELDPQELPFHKPKRIYEAAINSFRFKKDGYQCDFREFLRAIVESDNFYKLEEHKYLRSAIRRITEGGDNEYFWEWIEGHPTRYGYPPMYEYSTSANIYCYILSGIGWAARNIMGLDGFLILFDEAESVDRSNYAYYQNNKVWNVLKGLILMSSNDERLLRETIVRQYYPQGYWGVHTGLQYSGRFQVRFLWKNPCYVKSIFAFVPYQEILGGKPIKDIPPLEIENVEEEFLNRISKRISLIYEQAYNTTINHELLPRIYELLPRTNIRMFIKSAVYAFDLLHFHPHKKIEELLR